MSSHRVPSISLLCVGLLTLALSSLTTYQALVRYREIHSVWAWDLAYYNQWFWAVTRGDGAITVRPGALYAIEGPSVWKMNYLAPARFLIVPFYLLFPDPRTLLVVQNLVVWLVIPAAYGLARSESRSESVALSAAMLVPATPLLWPLIWNDFRELQLALPFVLWAIQGYRDRSVRLAAIGIVGLLACRQDYALVVASLALVPAREPEPAARTFRWARTAIVVGFAWIVVFFGYLVAVAGPRAPLDYLRQLGRPDPDAPGPAELAFEYLGIGLGSWTILACLAPRIAILAVPWAWSLIAGLWDPRRFASIEWSEVRYAAPLVGLILAGGLIGYARLARWALSRQGGRGLLASVWLLAALGLLAGRHAILDRISKSPRALTPAEARDAWRWIRQVGPDEGVLATYPVSAPLSSRRLLYSYHQRQDRPRGYPRFPREVTWAFYHRGDIAPWILARQGFELVHEGPFLWIWRRRDEPGG